MPKPVKAVLIGAGNRGEAVYGRHALAHPEEIQFVAVAEPNQARRERFAQAHQIPQENRYHTWEELLGREQIADAALVCTQDHMHAAPVLTALRAGYDVLVEKPMATTLADCMRLVKAAEETGRLLQVCHVLRYTAFFGMLHDIVASGRLGDVVTVEHRENVAYWHMAHSYVRGNWRNSAAASPMILAKCCHDLDLLYWILGPVQQLSSVGSLLHFRPENAPPGAPERCTDGCPHENTCPWSAIRLYLELIPLLHTGRTSESLFERMGSTLLLEYPRLTSWLRRVPAVDGAMDYRGWPISTISEDTDPESRRRALETGPYGRCVYRCDNDVVDHQVVSMQLESGASATLTMHGHSHQEGRTLRFDGTRATLRGRFMTNRQEIEIHDHLTGKIETIRPTVGQLRDSGHGGGDGRLVSAFVQAVRGQATARTTAQESLASHLLAFAAEQARQDGCVVEMDTFRRQAEKEIR